MASMMKSTIDSVITKSGAKALNGDSKRRSQRGTSRRRKGRKTCNPTQFLTSFTTTATVQEDVLRLYEAHLRQSPTFTAFFKEENKPKNNNPHVLVYDHSRVKLKDGNGGNYVHAQFVDGFYHPKQYICAQMPFSAETQTDLFRMMLQIRPKTVICMGKIDRELNLFPTKKDATKSGGRVSIKCVSATADPKVDQYTNLFVCGRKKFNFKVFCFNAWQDEAKIPSPEDLIDFHSAVRKSVPQKKKCHSGRTLVICPTGSSRSGLFVVLDKELERLKTEGRMRYGLSVRGCRYKLCNSFDRFELFETGIKCLTVRAKEYVKEHKGKK